MRRNTFELEIAVLQATQRPTLYTHIMYKAQTNTTTVKQIINKLLAKGFMITTKSPVKPNQQCKSANSKRIFYVTTPKGEQILKTALTLLKEMA